MTPPLLALRQVEEEMRQVEEEMRQVRVEDGGPASGVALPHQCDRWAARLRGAIAEIERDRLTEAELGTIEYAAAFWNDDSPLCKDLRAIVAKRKKP